MFLRYSGTLSAFLRPPTALIPESAHESSAAKKHEAPFSIISALCDSEKFFDLNIHNCPSQSVNTVSAMSQSYHPHGSIKAIPSSPAPFLQ